METLESLLLIDKPEKNMVLNQTCKIRKLNHFFWLSNDILFKKISKTPKLNLWQGSFMTDCKAKSPYHISMKPQQVGEKSFSTAKCVLGLYQVR